MITALVEFKLPQQVSIEEARDLFMGSAAKFQDFPGLLRKYFLLSEDCSSAGGVYLWESRERAEQMYTQAWLDDLQSRFGSTPSITWFNTPVVIDNISSEVVST